MTAKTDRELLELAAKGAGYDTSHPMNTERLSLDPPVDALWVSAGGKLAHTGWNPLTSDGDALRLAVKLGMQIDTRDPETRIYAIGAGDVVTAYHTNRDALAATRLAIVRTAAEIGETL